MISHTITEAEAVLGGTVTIDGDTFTIDRLHVGPDGVLAIGSTAGYDVGSVVVLMDVRPMCYRCEAAHADAATREQRTIDAMATECPICGTRWAKGLPMVWAYA